MCKVEGNMPIGKCAKAAWAEWAERGFGGIRGEAAAQAGMGRNLRKIPFRIKIEFLNIPRLWKFAQGDLVGILT
jgi:hypothetical protein